MKSLYNLILVAFVIGITNFYSNAQCDHTVTLRDSYGDGWNGGSINVMVNGAFVLTNLTISSGAGPESHTFTAKEGDAITVDYFAGSYGWENYFSVQDGGGNYLTVTSSSNPEWRPYYDGSPWVGTGACPAPSYCLADGGTIDEYIAQVDFLNISNASGSSLYTDYTGIVADPIAVGETHPISIVNGQAYGADQLGIWIDWNQDTDFDDAGETITVSGGPEIWTANITVPGSVPAGQTTTRMRIRIMYTGSVSSCGSASYGEVEDYTITTIGSSPCSGTPTGGTASLTASDNCAATQGTLTASGFENSTTGLSYDWEFSANGSSGWASTGVAVSTAYGTPASTTYYRYATTCATSGITAYTNVIERTVATVTAGSDVTRCGTGTVDLTASTNDGSVNWYAASSGGSSLSSGGTYSPSISSSTTYYAASSGCTGTRVAVAGTVNEAPTSLTANSSASDVCDGDQISLSSSSTGTFTDRIIGSSSGSSTTLPFRTYWHDSRLQYIIPASELTAAQITAGQLNSISFNVTTVNSLSMNNFTIKLANTAAQTYSGSFKTESFTTVYSGSYTVPGTGWQQIDFQSNFTWDGTSNIVVDICYDNTTWSGYSYVYYENTYGNSGMYASVDNASGCALSATSTINYRPWTRFGAEDLITYVWSADVGGYSSNDQNPTGVAPSQNTTYTVTASNTNGCSATSSTAVSFYENPVAGSVAVSDLSVSGNSDLTEAIEADAITWTNSGTANGDIQYFYEWTDNSGTSPTGSWNAWVTTNPNVWNANSSGGNMNKTLWVKTVTTSTNGCGTAESSSTWIDVRNCRAGATGASVSAGTVANMPFGETITYDATLVDGTFERFQYQWNSTSGSWSDWSTTDPLAYATDINPGQTLYVRSKIIGESSSGSPTCTDYSDAVQTVLINCASTVAADAGSDDALCNGNSVVITGSGSGNSAVTGYSWSPATELSSTAIANPTVSATSSRTYTLTTTHADGCTSTDDIIITVDDAPVITSSSTVTDVTTCGEISIDVVVSANAGEGAWSNTGIGSFDANTDASTTFQSNTFDTDMTLTWTQTSGGCSGSLATITARFNQPVTTSLNAYTFDTECWIWGGLTNTEWSTAANWYKYDGSKWLRQSSSTPGASDKVYLMSYTNAGSLCVSNSNDAIIPATAVTDLIVGSGAEVDLNGSFSLAGDLTNNGTINYGTSSVSMTGGSDQTISGSATTLNNLTVNKTGGSLIVSTPITVMGTLDMSAGNIVNSSIVILGSSSAAPGTLSHTTGIITGEFRRYFPNATGSQLFPIGTASVMRDVSVNFTSAPGSNQYLTASYVTGAPTLFGGGAYEGLPLIAADGQLITNYDNEGHWVINPTNDDYTSTINGKAYTISLHMNGIADATDYSKTRIIKSAGSNTASQHHLSWEALTNQSVSGYNGANPSNSNFAVTATSTGFSVFGGGSDNGDPLPVELVSFNGSCNDGLVELIWETASEYNSSHFDVENSRDGIIWDVVKTIEAAGNSNEMLTYKYTDVNAHGGNNYYRLTQVDIDGTSKTYDIINVSCSQTTAGYFSIFPNPSSGSFQVILNNSDIIGDAEMNIVDTKGNSVLMKSIDVKSGINMYVVDEELAPGIYYICVKNGDKTTTVLKHSVK